MTPPARPSLAPEPAATRASDPVLAAPPGAPGWAAPVITDGYRQEMASGGLLTRVPVSAHVPEQRRPAHRRPRQIQWPTVLCSVLITLGAVARVRQYAVRRSLWLDEASIADNILNRHAAGLLRPLAHHQGAPLGWLLSEKLGVHLLGPNEYGLRLTSLVAGILTLFVVWWLARRTLPRWLVPLAVAAAAVSPQLIRYSSETKQYSSDAFAVTLIVAVAVTIARRRPVRLGWNSAVLWAVAGAFVVLLSHPGIVATLACCLVLLLRLWFSGYKRVFVRFVAASAVIFAVVLVLYELVLKDLADDDGLKDYWKAGNPPKPLAFGSFMRWLGRVIVDYAHDPLHLGPTLLVGILFVAGMVGLARRGRYVCLLLVAPLALQLLVSAVGIFPLSGRLVLGYVPLILVVVAAAPNVLGGRRWVGAGVACLVLVTLVPNAADAARVTANPLRFEEIRPVMQAVQRDFQPGQVLYVHYPALPAFKFYQEHGIHLKSNGNMFTIPGSACRDDDLLRRLHVIGGQVWFVSAHQLGRTPHEADQVRRRLRAEGTVLRDIKAPGAEAILVKIRDRFDELTPGAPQNCLQVVRTS